VTDYVLVGGGAFAREIHDWFLPGLPEGDRFVGYLDDGDRPMAAFGRDLPQLGDTNAFDRAPDQRLVMAVGDPTGKVALAGRLGGSEAFATLIHPRAWVSASARLGRGAVVGPFADVSADSKAGDLVTLNAYSSLGHDVSVGDFVTLSGYVDLTGGVTVGARSFFGSGARVLPRLSIGADCMIGAGAVVVRGVEDRVTLYAAPARRL
jgi:sugar O-acyltransferase (sialic acid O-acetyltransferase NeuD family)